MMRNITGGSISNKRDTKGLWVGYIELDGPSGQRKPRKYVRRKDKDELRTELGRLYAFYKQNGYLPDSQMTVGQWLNYWLTELAAKEKRPKTLAGYRSVLHGWVIPAIGNVKLSKLSAADVRAVAQHMEDSGLSSTYALNAHRVLSAALEDAVREEKIPTNPAKRARAPKKAVARLEVLTLDEALRVLREVDEHAHRALWRMVLMTAARRGEVIGLEVNRVTDVIDLSWQLQRLKLTPDTGVPIVPADFEYRHLVDGLYLTRPKSRAGWRIIPLAGPLKVAFDRHIAEMPPNPWGLMWVDPNGRPIDPDQHTRNWRKLLLQTGIQKDVRLHDLRHTAVDLLYAAGVPEDIIVKIVGHSRVMMTRSYQSRGDTERARMALELAGEPFNQLDGARSGTPAAIES